MDIKILILPAILCTTSCGANFNSIHRNTKISDSTSAISIDAKQRLLISSTVIEKVKDSSGAVTEKTYPVLCSEPSPDIFSVYSAAIEASASKADELTAAFKSTTSENGGTIGIRTESIQLLRDAMYRLCEAYAAGGLSSLEYYKMVSKYQKSMVTLIAISQLTGASKPSQLVLSSTSSLAQTSKAFESKENLDKARKELESLNGDLDSLDNKIKESSNALSGKYTEKCPDGVAKDEADKEKCENHKKLLSEKSTLQSKITLSEKNVNEWLQMFTNSNEAIVLTSEATSKAIENSSTAMDKESIIALSGTVQKLVSDVFLDDIMSTCIDEMQNITSQDSLDTRNRLIKNSLDEIKYNKAQDLMLDICSTIINSKLKK